MGAAFRGLWSDPFYAGDGPHVPVRTRSFSGVTCINPSRLRVFPAGAAVLHEVLGLLRHRVTEQRGYQVQGQVYSRSLATGGVGDGIRLHVAGAGRSQA